MPKVIVQPKRKMYTPGGISPALFYRSSILKKIAVNNVLGESLPLFSSKGGGECEEALSLKDEENKRRGKLTNRGKSEMRIVCVCVKSRSRKR
jgi:hypothetical protein